MDEKDCRVPCQYGSSCYQKNETHHAKYKHPANSDDNAKKRQRQEDETSASQCSDNAAPRKPKIDAATSSGNLKQQTLNFFFKKNSSKSAEIPKSNSESLQENIKNTETISKNSVIDLDKGREIIKKLFLVDMSDDFFSFWKFCQNLCQNNAADALKSIDFELIGPFDVLAGKLTEENALDSSVILRHWRYYYDPPEFQTILKRNGPDLFHVGYFRDEPNSLPVFVACNSAAKDAIITPIGENVFGALDWCIRQFEKKCSPYQKMKYSSLKTALHNWAKEHGFTLDSSTANTRTRNRNVVAKTLHHAGIVVPYDKKTELGYRPLAETEANLVKLLKQLDETKNEEERKVYLSKLHEIVTWANIAMDEGDYGTCLELGLDLFSFGSHHVHRMALQLLTSAYDLLGRHLFSKIIKAHLEDRRKGDKLSIIK